MCSTKKQIGLAVATTKLTYLYWNRPLDLDGSLLLFSFEFGARAAWTEALLDEAWYCSSIA